MNKNEIKKYRKGLLKLKFFFFVGRFNLTLPIKLLLNFHGKKIRIKEEPFLLFVNHVENLDPFYEFICFNTYIRNVISDHLARNKFVRRMLNFFVAPIVNNREKSTDILYNEIVNNIKAGVNVAVHIEGGKNTNGETAYISKRNAVLAKECGCPLITYRLSGGYVKTPRWAIKSRKGPTFGKVANIYSKEQIKNMSVDELYECILKDLYVNVYDEQRKEPHKYKGKKSAECAETTLYGCPKCQNIGTLKSCDDEIFCTCGFSAKIDEYGFWHGNDLPFDNIVEWDKFQKNLIKKLADEKKGTAELLFSDEKQTVSYLENDKIVVRSTDAKLELFGNCITITDKEKTVIPIEKIKKICYISRMNLLIVTEDHYYEIKSPYPRSATKYIVAVRYLKGKENK